MHKKIILADMDLDFRNRLTRYILEKPNVVIDEVDSGTDLIEKTKKGQYDAIISDIILSDDMNGIQAVREIRKYNQRIPILMMSVQATRFIEYTLHRLPVNCVLYKPFGRTAFLESLDKLLGENKHE